MNGLYFDKLRRKVAAVVRVMEDPGFSVLARLVFAELLLAFHNTMDERCDPAAETVGRRLGRTERSVRGAIAELEARGEIRSRQRRRESPEYSFPALKSDQDRTVSSGLEGQARKFSASRPEETRLQDRKVSSDKPYKRTREENLERGTCISPDWKPSRADLDFAIRFGLSEHEAEAEADKFRDYYQAAGSIKADWSAAWRNWARNVPKYRDRAAKGGAAAIRERSIAAQRLFADSRPRCTKYGEKSGLAQLESRLFM